MPHQTEQQESDQEKKAEMPEDRRISSAQVAKNEQAVQALVSAETGSTQHKKKEQQEGGTEFRQAKEVGEERFATLRTRVQEIKNEIERRKQDSRYKNAENDRRRALSDPTYQRVQQEVIDLGNKIMQMRGQLNEMPVSPLSSRYDERLRLKNELQKKETEYSALEDKENTLYDEARRHLSIMNEILGDLPARLDAATQELESER